MTENKHGRSSDDDPLEAQLRFEAALYGDWYSQSVLASYVQEKSSEKSIPRSRRSPGQTVSRAGTEHGSLIDGLTALPAS